MRYRTSRSMFYGNQKIRRQLFKYVRYFSNIQRVYLTYHQGGNVTSDRKNGHGIADRYLVCSYLHPATAREPGIRISLSHRPIRLFNGCSNSRSHSTASPLAKRRSNEELAWTAPQPAR